MDGVFDMVVHFFECEKKGSFAWATRPPARVCSTCPKTFPKRWEIWRWGRCPFKRNRGSINSVMLFFEKDTGKPYFFVLADPGRTQTPSFLPIKIAICQTKVVICQIKIAICQIKLVKPKMELATSHSEFTFFF